MSTYTAKDIEVLEGLEPVRKRPAMYIGGTDSRGLHHLLWEIVDNAVDEHLNQCANSPCVPCIRTAAQRPSPTTGVESRSTSTRRYETVGLELILTTLHAGGKFSDAKLSAFGGLHGVGLSVVNALSKKMIATVRRDGQRVPSREFARGIAAGASWKLWARPRARHGTSMFFRPDEQIFPRTQFVAETIRTPSRRRLVHSQRPQRSPSRMKRPRKPRTKQPGWDSRLPGDQARFRTRRSRSSTAFFLVERTGRAHRSRHAVDRVDR